MKKRLLSLAVAMLLLGLAVATAFAATLTPEADTFVDFQSANQNTNYNTMELRLSGSADPEGNCTPTRTALLRFDVAAEPQAYTTAVLRVTTGLDAGSAGAANRIVAVYAIANDTWNETTATYANTLGNGSMVRGAQLDTATLPNLSPIPSGQVVEFTSQALADFVNAQIAGDNKVSLAIQFTTCATVSTQWFQDKEGGSVAAVLELTGPTAVELTSAEAQQQPNTWPFYAGIAAVALLVVAGVTISRRRTA